MYKSLVFDDTFLAQGLHLSHTRGVQLGLGLGMLMSKACRIKHKRLEAVKVLQLNI